jgi:hypothetical protein
MHRTILQTVCPCSNNSLYIFLDIKLNKYDTWGEKCKAKFGSNQYLFHAIAKIIQDGLFITLQISVQKSRALMHILLFTLQL